MRTRIAPALLLLWAACDRQALEPCAASTEKPVVEIAAARDRVSHAPLAALRITHVSVDGVPVDTAVLRTNPWNVERATGGFVCTLPCLFGRDSGIYTFEARATGYYQTLAQVDAAYTAIPAGCPASHGLPTRVVLALTEADSARVIFSFATRRATGLGTGISSVTFDDGSGPRTSAVSAPWPVHQTRNTGTLHVRFVVGAPDTIAVGEMDLPLRKDWQWSVGGYIYDRNPTYESFCIQARSFPLRRPIPGADSLYLGWAGGPISEQVAC